MLVSFDQESEDAADDDDHEWRNGRHPEQVWLFLSLKFAESAHTVSKSGGRVLDKTES
jgi:hypothetical protein